MAENDTSILDGKNAIPNKLLQSNGTITDLTGNSVSNMVDSYKAKPAIPNKFLNADGTYSTLEELIGGMVDTEIFIVVEELPESGNEQKIYLVPDGEGGFIEYHWTGSAWDPIGNIGTDISVDPQVYYCRSMSQPETLAFWNEIMRVNENNDVLVIEESNTPTQFANMIPIPKGIIKTSRKTSSYNYIVYNDIDPFTQSKSSYTVYQAYVSFTIVDGVITSASRPTSNLKTIYYLSPDLNYNNPYTPQYPGSPATKKYVDDAIANSITTVLGGEY